MQLLNFLVSIICFFLLLFAIHLFFAKKGNKRQNILLSIIFFARFGQILTSIVMSSRQTTLLSILYQGFTPLYFAAPAIFYLYFKGFIKDDKRIGKLEYLHFIPALTAIIHVIPWPGVENLNWNHIASELSENGYHSLRAKSGLFPAYFHFLFRPILTLVYLVLCWKVVIQSGIRKKTSSDNPGRNWILFLLNIATFFQLSGLVPILLRNLHIPLQNIAFITLNCLVLLTMVLYALHKPHIFYGYLLVSINWDKNDVIPESSSLSINESKTSPPIKIDRANSFLEKKSILNLQQISLYAQLMKDAMENEQLYLKPGLQIIDLASKINIPVHHCSYVINSHIGKNFRDWINAYRVNHFLKLYPIQGERITIEAIAQESGFKSNATFYNAFKKEKGVMPTAYLSLKAEN